MSVQACRIRGFGYKFDYEYPLFSFIKGEDAESTFNNINVFEAKFNEALEKMVTERLRGSVPKVATVSGGITKEDFKKMSLAQQAELAKKDKDLYLELSKN